MKVINIQNAKTHLSKLVEEVLQGEEVVIAKSGKPLIRLTPFQVQLQPRALGVLAGQVTEAEDCWEDDPELEKQFYESDNPSVQYVAEGKS